MGGVEGVDEVAEEEVEFYEGRLGNDFKSARDDISRSHYTALGPILGQYSMVTNFDNRKTLGNRFLRIRGELARLGVLVDRVGLPEKAAEEAANIYLHLVERVGLAASRKDYELAIIIAAARRLRIPVTPSLWYTAAAAILGIPDDASKWTPNESRAVTTLLRQAQSRLFLMTKLGIYIPPPASPLEAIPDPQLRYHAIRLYNELKEIGAPGTSPTRYLATYLASVALNRPLSKAELDKMAKTYVGTAGNGPWPRRNPVIGKKALGLLNNIVIHATLAPGSAPQPPQPSRGSGSREPVARLRLRCSSCGHEWDEVAYASRSGTFKLGAIGRTIFNAVCPRCGARLGRVVELHVRPSNG